MLSKDVPIRRKLIIANLLTSGAVLLITCAAFFAYEFLTFRQSMVQELRTVGEITAANSTAALAFDDLQAATETLEALKAEEHIVLAVLYDTAGHPFAQYPATISVTQLPSTADAFADFHFEDAHLEGYLPVIQGDMRLGTLYIKSNLEAMNGRFRLYGVIALCVIGISFVLAYLLSRIFQRSISMPILALAETAKAVSDRQDYSVRAVEQGSDEIGLLTNTFNQMLMRIQGQNQALKGFNKDLEEKVRARTQELETAIQEQREAEKEVYEKNKELSSALEELQSTEEQLLELNNELEARVERRTKALSASEEELKEKNQELERTNVDLDNFIYTASHDLKSPIVNLEGLINLIRVKLEDNEQSNHLQLIEMMDTSVLKLKKTISDLAEITKVQKNLGDEPEEVTFQEIIQDVKEDIEPAIKEAGAQLTEEFEVPSVLYPRKNLRSILYNLLSNAIKYRSPERVAEIKVRTFHEDGTVVLAVEDNGLGISEEQQPKLFSMFKRFHAHVEGTGIGLYIIKRAVENRGGRIEYIEKDGQGSIFKVYM